MRPKKFDFWRKLDSEKLQQQIILHFLPEGVALLVRLHEAYPRKNLKETPPGSNRAFSLSRTDGLERENKYFPHAEPLHTQDYKRVLASVKECDKILGGDLPWTNNTPSSFKVKRTNLTQWNKRMMFEKTYGCQSIKIYIYNRIQKSKQKPVLPSVYLEASSFCHICSERLILINSWPDALAMAWTRLVLPTPGDPSNKMGRGYPQHCISSSSCSTCLFRNSRQAWYASFTPLDVADVVVADVDNDDETKILDPAPKASRKTRQAPWT
ncbi:hypothetical protein pdam_00004564 [Pocillopora damicornis]|uniref:Uncharacterized protein n=1 Tax=Pocillopora damicornis TaxID=46731 RepID=A0A3M6ULT9_POCDA|nr:hypothetical protein pdam_00004564 [Pocillopora damicornis]